MNPSANDLNRLGVSHAQKREFQQAAECFRKALAADPASADACINLGNVLAELGDIESAKSSYRQALALRPQDVGVYCNFGALLTRVNDHSGAAACFRRAAELDPNNAQAHAWLGITLSRLRRHQEAIPPLRRALALNPQQAAIHSSLGAALIKTGAYEAGLESLAEALRQKPDLPDAQFQMAEALMALGRTSQALTHFDAALKLIPADPERHCQYAAALLEAGRLPESLAHLDAALKLKPDYEAALLGRSLVLLLSGDYANGWSEHGRRINNRAVVRFGHPKPIWDGAPLAGRTLLLEADQQGRGDTIQFVRYAQDIKRRHEGRIVVAVEPPLVPLLAGIAGADFLISQSEPRPPFELWAPLLSLPAIMQHHASSFPARIPYLQADPVRVERWKARLANRSAIVSLAPRLQEFKIGIAWQGSKVNQFDFVRSFPLSAFARIGKLPGISLISLQKGDGTEQLAGLTDFSVQTLGDDFDASGGAFLDTAAVMQSLDLVISADTSIGHVAGALGVPIWLALSYVPDWRWTMHGDHTPWYPTMRLFRQPSPGDWPSVFQQMATELAAITSNRRGRNDN